MDKEQYDDGYRHGAGSTQDQARGARDAQADRDRREREQREAWDRIRQQEEQLRDEERRRDQGRRDAERRREEDERAAQLEAKSSSVSASGSSGSSTTKPSSGSKSGSGTQGFIGLLGFIAGAWFGHSAFGENWIGVLVCAFILAGVAAFLYRLIIGVAVAIGALWLWVESSKESADAPSAPSQQPVISTAGESPTAGTAALSSYPLRFNNYCRFPVHVAIEYQNAQGQRQINGHWSVPALAMDWHVQEVGGAPLMVSDSSVLLTAYIPDHRYEWVGAHQREVAGQTLRMMPLELGMTALGAYTLGIHCNDYVPPPTPSFPAATSPTVATTIPPAAQSSTTAPAFEGVDELDARFLASHGITVTVDRRPASSDGQVMTVTFVDSLALDSGASRAGVQSYDQIMSIDDMAVYGAHDVVTAIDRAVSSGAKETIWTVARTRRDDAGAWVGLPRVHTFRVPL